MGLSGALHTGLSFFGLLNAASALPALRLGRPRTAWPGELQRFHVLPSLQEGLGLLCYTGSAGSVRRATLDNPDSTARHFGPSLEQPRMARFLLRCLRAFSSLTLASDSSASPGIEAARFATLPGRLHTSGSSGLAATARQTHASVEYLRTHAGLGQDCSRQAVPNATSCHK